MEDYYGYHPTRLLHRPIALTGFMGCPLDQIGSIVTNLSGLPLHDIDRGVEHSAGCSTAQLVLEQGECAYRTLEAEVVAKALRSQPPGVLVLGDGALLRDSTMAAIESNSVLVYVHHELRELLARIRHRRLSAPACYYPWIGTDGPCETELAVTLSQRVESYERATLQVDGTDRSADSIAHEILGHFQLLNAKSSSEGKNR